MQYRFNPAEPADYAEWGRLVGAFARHLVDRYGIREVRTWPPEVWNEPNLPRIRRIDADHANPYREWVELGSPEYPTRRQLRRIEEASELMEESLTLDRDPATGPAALILTLPAEAVAAVHARSDR